MRPLKTLKIPSGFSYLTLYDSPKRPIGKSKTGPKAPSVEPIRVWGAKVPKPSAGARRRVASGYPNLLVAKIAKITATPSIMVKSSRRGFLGS